MYCGVPQSGRRVQQSPCVGGRDTLKQPLCHVLKQPKIATRNVFIGIFIVGVGLQTHWCQFKKIFLVGGVSNPDLTGEFS